MFSKLDLILRKSYIEKIERPYNLYKDENTLFINKLVLRWNSMFIKYNINVHKIHAVIQSKKKKNRSKNSE